MAMTPFELANSMSEPLMLKIACLIDKPAILSALSTDSITVLAMSSTSIITPRRIPTEGVTLTPITRRFSSPLTCCAMIVRVFEVPMSTPAMIKSLAIN